MLDRISAVGPIILSVADLGWQAAFHANTPSFSWAGESAHSGAAFGRLTGLPDALFRTAAVPAVRNHAAATLTGV
ncbi:MAG: hypothetical protein ACKVYV_00165 [Limisphaerales bacterium]